MSPAVGSPTCWFPPPAPPLRADKLWEHTVFEVFLRRPGEPGYVEFNFAALRKPWAAYRFTSLSGAGMTENLEEYPGRHAR